MSRKVINFVRLSQNGEYRIADLRQLVDKSYQKEKQKGAYQIAEISSEQYKLLENGKVLKNKDFGFVDLASAEKAISKVDILENENQSLQEELARLQKQIAESSAVKKTTKSSKKEVETSEVVEATETEDSEN